MINNLNFMLLLTQLRVLSHASQFCIFKKCQPLRCHGMTLIHAWIFNHTSVKSGGGGGGDLLSIPKRQRFKFGNK